MYAYYDINEEVVWGLGKTLKSAKEDAESVLKDWKSVDLADLDHGPISEELYEAVDLNGGEDVPMELIDGVLCLRAE